MLQFVLQLNHFTRLSFAQLRQIGWFWRIFSIHSANFVRILNFEALILRFLSHLYHSILSSFWIVQPDKIHQKLMPKVQSKSRAFFFYHNSFFPDCPQKITSHKLDNVVVGLIFQMHLHPNATKFLIRAKRLERTYEVIAREEQMTQSSIISPERLNLILLWEISWGFQIRQWMNRWMCFRMQLGTLVHTFGARGEC